MILAIVVLVVGLLLSYGLFKLISYVERTRPVPPKRKLTKAQAMAHVRRKK